MSQFFKNTAFATTKKTHYIFIQLIIYEGKMHLELFSRYDITDLTTLDWRSYVIVAF